MHGGEVGAGLGAAVAVLERRLERIQPQEGERQHLARAIVEVGADAPQGLFVQRRRPPGGLAHALVEPEVLVEALAQLGLLLADRVAAALDDAGQ